MLVVASTTNIRPSFVHEPASKCNSRTRYIPQGKLWQLNLKSTEQTRRILQKQSRTSYLDMNMMLLDVTNTN